MFSDICFEIKEVLAEDKKNYLYSDPLKFSDSLLDVDIVIPIENYSIFIKNLEEILIKSNNTIQDELNFFVKSCQTKEMISLPYPNSEIGKNILEVVLQAEIENFDKR